MDIQTNTFAGRTVMVTGGTDGIGAAAVRLFHQLGAQVIFIGRSHEKGGELMRTVGRNEMRLDFMPSDFSLMQNVVRSAEEVAQRVSRIDLLIHCVGILITKAAYTAEGLEKDFATGYLSRFLLTNRLHALGLLTRESTLINVAASGPNIPKMARLEFDVLSEVESRTGMVSHGQAQLANDLFSIEASKRLGLGVIGYGPGSVDTNIRRELPPLLVALLKPFFAFSTRTPDSVAIQLSDIYTGKAHQPGETVFFDKKGQFHPNAFVVNQTRRNQLWDVSERLVAKALAT